MLKTIALSLALSSALALPIAAQETEQPAYLVASLAVSDLDAYMNQYGMPVFPTLAEAGAEVLVGTPVVTGLEGDYSATWTAIVRFPSMDALNDWYNSDAYQALVSERQSLSDPTISVMFAAPGFVMPGQ